MKSAELDLSVITVTWSSAKLIPEQIRSVQVGCRKITFEQIIIDNNSPDETVKVIEEQFPGVTLIANKENKGFSAANNQGVEVARGKYLLFLNPDMRVEPGSLDTLVDWLQKRRDVGIVSPKLVDEEGQINWDASPRRFPKLWEQIALLLKIPHIFPNILDTYHMKDFDFDREQSVDSVRGSFMLMPRDFVLNLGWAYDPRYFFWYEDVDICREAKRLNYKVIYTPIVSCVDYVGQSVRKRTTLWKQKQFTASMLTYFKKWDPWYKWMWIALLRPVAIAMAWMGDRVQKNKKK